MKNNLIKHINFAFSKKSDGNMRVFIHKTNRQTEKNREKFFKKQKIDNQSVILAELVHKNRVAVVTNKDRGKTIMGVDSLVSNCPDLSLALTAADCLAIYFYNPKKKVIALTHAGWRGLLNLIIPKTIDSINKNYQAKAKDLRVVISPHIKKCHFEIKKDVLKKFKNYQNFIEKKDKIKVNLSAIAKEQLVKEGVLCKNIQISPECTYCLKDKYFSYRRNGNKNLETMIAYISLKNN